MGAGASIPFIADCDARLTTNYLTQQVSDQNRWATIYDEFKRSFPASSYPDCNFNISVHDILSVIKTLVGVNEFAIPQLIRDRVSVPLPETLDDVYGIGTRNFEWILYLLDKTCNYLYDQKSGVDNILFDVWTGHDAERQRLRAKKGWNYVPWLCREVLAQSILDLWDLCERDKAIEENKQFIASVLDNFESVSIYSLNYDPLLYEATRGIKVEGLTLLDGPRHTVDRVFETGFSDANGFNPKSFYLGANVIAFLHGHVGFLPEGGKDSMRFADSWREAQNRRISGVARGEVGYYRRGRKGTHYNVFLTSGLEKFESFYDNPYACYISRLADDIMESEYIVYIGSSLGDYHVNLFATNAWRLANGYAEEPQNLLALRKLTVGPKKMIVVTQDKAEQGFQQFLFTSDISKALFDLSREGFSWSKDMTDSSLKTDGYANVHNGWFLYLNGTERFFSDVWRIEGLW